MSSAAVASLLSFVDGAIEAERQRCREAVFGGAAKEEVQEVVLEAVLPDGKSGAAASGGEGSALSGLEGRKRAPSLRERSRKRKKRQRRAGAAQSSGDGWFNVPGAEMTPELEKAFHLLKMRAHIFKDRYYKKGFSKPEGFFAVGTIVDDAKDFYSSRATRKERKMSMVDDILAERDLRRHTKKRFREIRQKALAGGKVEYQRKRKKRTALHNRSAKDIRRMYRKGYEV